MLVLSRKEGERVVFLLPNGEKITVVVNSIKGNRNSLAIEAPQDVKILRGELDNEGNVSAKSA